MKNLNLSKNAKSLMFLAIATIVMITFMNVNLPDSIRVITLPKAKVTADKAEPVKTETDKGAVTATSDSKSEQKAVQSDAKSATTPQALVESKKESVEKADKGSIVLKKEGQIALAILLFALILWITEAIPFHFTGLIALLFLTLFKVGNYKEIIKTGFGDDIVIFFIGVLILSSFITQSGLGKRISVYVLSKTGNNTSAILLGFLIAGATLSMWITDMAVAAILMPLGRAILQEEGLKPLESNFGKALMISCAWGPLIGGIGTPAGCGANPVALTFLNDFLKTQPSMHPLSFLDWMAFGVPAAYLMIIPSWLVLKWVFPFEIKHLKKTKEELKQEFLDHPGMNRIEKVTLFVFVLTVILWIVTPFLGDLVGYNIEISMVLLFTTPLFFFPYLVTKKWKEIEPDIDWSGIILILAGIAIGKYLAQTGAAGWLAYLMLGKIGGLSAIMQLFVIAFGVCLLKVVFSSNTVTAVIIIPLIISLGASLNIDVIGITLAAGLTSSLAFILVTTTPTNVIPYTAGYFSIKDMAKAGIILTFFAAIIIAVVFLGVGKLYGIY